MYILHALCGSYSIGHECNKGGAAHQHISKCPILIVNKYLEEHVKRTLKIQLYEHSISAVEMNMMCPLSEVSMHTRVTCARSYVCM